MIRVISIEQTEEWNRIVKSFDDWDIYYTNEYATSLMLHGDGDPMLVSWEMDNNAICFVIMKEDIAGVKPFKGDLEKNYYFDATTPYGYGGPLIKGNIDKIVKSRYIDELKDILKNLGIISVFFRFHPLLSNHLNFKEEFNAKSFKSTICIDTSCEENIWNNMDSSNRNMIRKAIKSGVNIEFDKGERIEEFISIYNSTMDAHEADNYYYFEKEYYNFLVQEMKDNVLFAYSIIEGQVIGASILFYNDEYMHYHLSGTNRLYRKYASTNLLLYEASKWACAHGISKFHLGGGIDAEDSLYKFKKKFNKKGSLDFYIGRLITDTKKYDYLVNFRKSRDTEFDENNEFMIQYRK